VALAAPNAAIQITKPPPGCTHCADRGWHGKYFESREQPVRHLGQRVRRRDPRAV